MEKNTKLMDGYKIIEHQEIDENGDTDKRYYVFKKGKIFDRKLGSFSSVQAAMKAINKINDIENKKREIKKENDRELTVEEIFSEII